MGLRRKRQLLKDYGLRMQDVGGSVANFKKGELRFLRFPSFKKIIILFVYLRWGEIERDIHLCVFLC